MLTMISKEEMIRIREIFYEDFRHEVSTYLKTHPAIATRNPITSHDQEVISLHSLLERIQPPMTTDHLETHANQADALILNLKKFEKQVQKWQFLGPIFMVEEENAPTTADSQYDAPLHRLMQSVRDSDPLSVQIASTKIKTGVRAVRITISELKSIMNNPNSPHYPVNSLDLHASYSKRPAAFNAPDFGLLGDLSRLMVSQSGPTLGRTVYGAIPWIEREQWALVSRGGLTQPHTDSHGLWTYLSVEQGQMGFIWWSKPDEKDLEWWAENVAYNTGRGKWCYVVVKPGDMVFFPPLTVHAVFRLQQGEPTFVTGGHLLRYSLVGQWAKACAFQMRSPDHNVTNESVADVPEWIWKVAQMIARDQAADDESDQEAPNQQDQAPSRRLMDRLGGEESMDLFWSNARVSTP